MRGDDDVALAVAQAAPVLGVELLEIGEQLGRTRGVELLGELGSRVREPHGIEPEMRILVAVAQIERAASTLLDGVLERRLEAATDVDHEHGIAHCGDIAV